MLTSRGRFALLCGSQVSKGSADACFYTFCAARLLGYGSETSDQAGAVAATLCLFLTAAGIAFIALAPVNGAVSNSVSKRWLLAAGAAFCLCVATVAGATGAPLWVPILYVLGVAMYATARSALLPAVAWDALLPLNRAVGWIHAAGAAGIGAWITLACSRPALIGNGQAVVVGSAAMNLVPAIAAITAHFPSDRRKCTTAANALAGFFLDAGVILRSRHQTGRLLGQGSFLALFIAFVCALLQIVLGVESAAREALKQAGLVAAGFALGALLVSVQGHPRRALGLAAYGAVAFFLGVVWAVLGSHLTAPSLIAGMAAAVVLSPLCSAYLGDLPAEARGNGAALMNLSNCVFAILSALLSSRLLRVQAIDPARFLWILVALAAVTSLALWWVFLREALEQLVELILWPFYRVRAHGPGRFRIPQTGPLLVIANHTAWFDPLWLAKPIPRSVTPMMTSKYYDLPILHWLMVRVARAIRVPAATFRREAPELDEAVTVLDRGGCLVIFPEGFVKRREELPLRNFGQGVWRILSRRPETPVMVCWIEGGWGSYTSHFGSPPMTNKKLDRWRPIDIAVEEPRVLDRELLADQRATRSYLMRACLEARRHLGLKPLALPQANGEERDDSETEEEN